MTTAALALNAQHEAALKRAMSPAVNHMIHAAVAAQSANSSASAAAAGSRLPLAVPIFSPSTASPHEILSVVSAESQKEQRQKMQHVRDERFAKIRRQLQRQSPPHKHRVQNPAAVFLFTSSILRLIPVLVFGALLAASIYGVIFSVRVARSIQSERLSMLILCSIAACSSFMCIVMSIVQSIVDLTSSVLYGLFSAIEPREQIRNGKMLRMSIISIVFYLFALIVFGASSLGVMILLLLRPVVFYLPPQLLLTPTYAKLIPTIAIVVLSIVFIVFWIGSFIDIFLRIRFARKRDALLRAERTANEVHAAELSIMPGIDISSA